MLDVLTLYPVANIFCYGLEFLGSQMCPLFLSFMVSGLCILLGRSLPRLQECFPILASNTFIV